MKIFMSHSSRQKLFVKELRRYLPEHIDLWIDEKQLLIGDDLGSTIKKTIEQEVDFLILVIDNYAIESEWVVKEFNWGLKRETELGRVFVLPILLEREAWEKVPDENIKKRKYIRCTEFTDTAIKAAAADLINEMFALVCKQLKGEDSLNQKNATVRLLEDADNFTSNIAEKIRFIVYPYRQDNPLDLINLLDILKEQSYLTDLSIFEFNSLIVRLQKQNLLTGIVNDGESIWVQQEHHDWKKAIYAENKRKIAKKAVSFIKSGYIIALDSGSTTLEIAKHITKGLKMQLWENLTVITNSIPAAQELLSISAEMTLGDRNNIMKVFMTEGRIRPNSLAVVDDDEIFAGRDSGFQEILSAIGGADICFVGANGLFEEKGFAVHNSFELKTKNAVLNNSKRKFIVSDPSKFRIKEQRMFVDFNSHLEVITTREGYEEAFDEFSQIVQLTNTKIICV